MGKRRGKSVLDLQRQKSALEVIETLGRFMPNIYGVLFFSEKVVRLVEEEKRAWIKKLAAKQVEGARRVQAIRKERGIPPWWKESNENTRRDLQAVSVEHYLQRVEAALEVEGGPSKELELIKVKCLTHRRGVDILRNATKQEPKNRKVLEGLFREIESLVNDLDNSTGFDLFDEATWQNKK
jgi:hypothetical protein